MPRSDLGTNGAGRVMVAASRRLAWVITLCGAVGLVAAAVLAYEKYRLLANPFYTPSCNISSAVNCTAVMQSDQSNAFGFPNPYLGLVGFAVVLTIGLALLAGSTFAGWFWSGLNVGILAGAGFVLWLMYQSAVEIEAYCPYCMVVWVVTAILTVAVSAHTFRRLRSPAGPVSADRA